MRLRRLQTGGWLRPWHVFPIFHYIYFESNASMMSSIYIKVVSIIHLSAFVRRNSSVSLVSDCLSV